MGTHDREGLLTRYRISFLVNIILLVIILAYLFKLSQTGIPVKVVSYEKQDLTVKNLETLTRNELDSERTDGVLVIKKKDGEQADLVFYGKGLAGMTAGAGSSIKELMLQLGSGSTDAYAGDDNCRSVLVFRGQVYCIPW